MSTIFVTTQGAAVTATDLASMRLAHGLTVTLSRPLPPVAMIAARVR